MTGRRTPILLITSFLAMLVIAVLLTHPRTAHPGRLEERGAQADSAASTARQRRLTADAPSRPRSSSRYRVDWRKRWLDEKAHRLRVQRYAAGQHAHVQRLLRELHARARATQAHHETDWRARQIAAAETIARESHGDPWPHCPDPYDGSGASWDDTARCENSGNWLDSPGYYRCGLQFDPMWERRFGPLCP